jgi:hypothetical protein
LLLPTRESQRVVVESVVHLVPQRGLPQRLLDECRLFVAVVPADEPRQEPRPYRPVFSRPVGDVVAYRLRERVGRLKHHPDALAEFDEVDAVPVDVRPVEGNRPVDAGRPNPVVHAVETAEERRLPTARRTDEGGDAILGNLHRDGVQRLLVAVVDVEVLHGEFRVPVELVVGPLRAALLLALAGRRLALLSRVVDE